jgi:hypothetical protein
VFATYRDALAPAVTSHDVFRGVCLDKQPAGSAPGLDDHHKGGKARAHQLIGGTRVMGRELARHGLMA